MKPGKERYTVIYMPFQFICFNNIHGCIYFDCCCFVYIFPLLVCLSADVFMFSMQTQIIIIHQINFGFIYPRAWKMETWVDYTNAFNELLPDITSPITEVDTFPQ